MSIATSLETTTPLPLSGSFNPLQMVAIPTVRRDPVVAITAEDEAAFTIIAAIADATACGDQ